jgi:hypothetical protein
VRLSKSSPKGLCYTTHAPPHIPISILLVKAEIPLEVNDNEGNLGLADSSMLRVGITKDHSLRPGRR